MHGKRERNYALLKLLVILASLVVLCLFEVKLFGLTYTSIYTKVAALIFGFWICIYSESSLISGIMLLACFREESEGKIDWQGIRLFLLMIIIAVALQVIFWAIVLKYKFAWHIFFVAVAISAILFFLFKRKSSI